MEACVGDACCLLLVDDGDVVADDDDDDDGDGRGEDTKVIKCEAARLIG